MKAGLTEALRKRLRRADRRVKTIVHAVVTAASDQKATKDEWNGADSTAGLSVLDRGVILSGGNADLFDRDLDDQNTTIGGIFPQDSTNVFIASMEWDLSSIDPDFVLESITAELNPDVDAGGADVVQWVCQLFSGTELELEIEDRLSSVYPISNKVYVTAGASTGRVTFDFGNNSGGSPVRPGSWPAPGTADGTPVGDKLFGRPTTFVAIWGIDAQGEPVGNIAWRTSAGTSSNTYTENGHRVRGWTSSPGGPTSQIAGGVQLIGSFLPNLEAVYTTYSAATITFDTGNPLDLGAVPTGTVEFTAIGQEPGGSVLTYEVRNDADSAWVEFNDGDTTDDLAGVGLRQVYEFRVTLTPGTGTSPVLQVVAVRELDRTSLDDLATVQERGSLAIDPITLRGEIMEYDVTVVRDGRRDFGDAITEILSTNDISDIEIEIYIGHPDLARKDWFLVDTVLVDDHSDTQSAITLNCLSVNRELTQPIPEVKGSGSLTSDPLVYSNETLKAVWDDVLGNQVTLAGRYVGPGVEVTTKSVSNSLDKSTARDILDAVAYVAGGGVIASQGKIQFRSLYPTDPGGIVAVMPKEEVSPVAVSPGARYRTPRVSITYGYDINAAEFTKQYQAEQSNALAAYGVASLQRAEVPDKVGRWVTADADAEGICERIVQSIAEGLILWAAKSIVPYPELEPGDLIAIEVEEFVAKDPNAARAIKGPQLALGVVTAVNDIYGTDFDVWIKDLSDIIPTTTEVTRTTLFGDEDNVGPLGLQDFRLAIQGSTEALYAWTAGALVDQVKVQDVLVALPASSDPWPGSTTAPTATILSTQAQQYSAAYPDADEARYITWRPQTAGGVLGPIVRRVLDAPRPPIVDVDFSETDAVGTLWLSAKGVGIKSVAFASKVGRLTQSTFAPATRIGSTGSTAASVVKGGFLGPGEYEKDVNLANNLNSFIRGRITLYNDAQQVYGPFTFDAGNIPAILSAVSKDRKVFVTGDTDVRSLLLKRVGGSSWRQSFDGTGAEWNVASVQNGSTGLKSTESWAMRVVAFRVGKASASTSSTETGAFVTADLTVNGESFAGSTLGFASPQPLAVQPSTGSANAGLKLQATVSSTSFDYKVERRFTVGGGTPVSYSDITGTLSPAAGTISTSLSTHTYATAFPRMAGGGNTVQYDFRCSILNSTGGVVVQEVASVTWDISSTEE